MATVITANASTKPSARSPVGHLGGANGAATVTVGAAMAAPKAAYSQFRKTVPRESGRIDLCTVGPYPAPRPVASPQSAKAHPDKGRAAFHSRWRSESVPSDGTVGRPSGSGRVREPAAHGAGSLNAGGANPHVER